MARALEELGARACFMQADLENEEDCRAVIAVADREFGRLDGLVHAAGLTNRAEMMTGALIDFDQKVIGGL